MRNAAAVICHVSKIVWVAKIANNVIINEVIIFFDWVVMGGDYLIIVALIRVKSTANSERIRLLLQAISLT